MKRIMQVQKHITTQTVGKPTVYRVEMKFTAFGVHTWLKVEKDGLSLHSLNPDIFDEFPRGQKFSVEIKPTEQTQLPDAR